ncbi:MAG: PAS domain S-box protein [bacterium]|nr:PAS domain S-box protein [bacterium]
MLRHLRQRRARTAAAELSREIARRFTSADSTAGLDQFAAAVADIEGVAGALIATCDREGYPLAFGEEGLTIESDVPLDVLASARSGLEPGTGWSRLTTNGSIALPGDVWARTCHGSDPPRGLVLVRLLEPSAESIVTGCIDHALDHLEWALASVLTNEQTRLVERLHNLEGEQVGSSQLLDTAVVAERLRGIFDANAVTILIREQGKLYLSATTDEALAETPVTYDQGVGFAGFVLDTNTPVRLYDARDNEEIEAKVREDLDREDGFLHPESLAAGKEPFRFLAVPMRFSGNPTGVIRLLREKHKPPFTVEEQTALQHSANLLAAMMFFSWRQYLATAVLDAETEAVCITRSEPGTVYSVPLVVYAESGAKKLFRRDITGMDASSLYSEGEYDRIQKLLEEGIARGDREFGPIKTKVTRFGETGNEIRRVDISYRFVTSPFVKPETHYTTAVIRDTTEEQLRARRDKLLAIEHERLSSLLDHKGLAYFAADGGGRTMATSLTETRLTGYSSDDLLGEHRKILYERQADQDDLMAQMRGKRGDFVHTVRRLKRKDHELFLAEGIARVLYDEDGQEIGYEGLYEDVTDRMRLQGFLDLDTKRVIKAQELFEKLRENASFQLLFMNSFAHQVRSPLGALIHHLVNFRKGIIDATRFKDELGYVIGQANVCALQIENLTYMDKILRGESFEFAQVNLAKLAIQTKLDFEHLAVDKKIRVEVDGTSIDKHLLIRGHNELLRQVLVNLIDNGIKYSVPHTRIRIRGCAGPQCYLQVTSRGLPIPREDRERIFERGFRRPAAKAAVPDGTGLGLWLVRKILAAHNATIRCTEILEEKRERTAFQIFFKHPTLDRSVSRRSAA